MEDEETIDIYEKSESPFILACGPHFLSFSLSVMTRCGTHALVSCVTNEGVLTFRCFPSKSRLKKQTDVSPEKENRVETQTCSFAADFCPCVLQENIH